MTDCIPTNGWRRVGRVVLATGCLLTAVGASFAPWVDRPSAALVLTAPDLAEFVKFLPEVRAGTLAVERLAFLLPLFGVTFGLPWVLSVTWLAYPAWIRRLGLMAVCPLSLVLLPPVWSPAVLLSEEFRLQTIGCGFCLAMVIGSRWLPRIPSGLLLVLPGLWVTAAVWASWQFNVVQPAVALAYAGPIVPGWGAYATCVGTVLMATGLTLASLGGVGRR